MKEARKKKIDRMQKKSGLEKKAMNSKHGRRRYIDDYKLVGKELIYYGSWYILEGDARDRRRYNVTMTLCACAAAVSAAVPGFTHIRGMYTPYVLIPYVVWLMAAVLCVVDAVKVWNAGERLNREQFERGAKRNRHGALVLLCAAAAAVLGQTAFLLFLDGGGSLAGELLFEFCAAVGAAAGFVMFRTAKNASWKIKKQ